MTMVYMLDDLDLFGVHRWRRWANTSFDFLWRPRSSEPKYYPLRLVLPRPVCDRHFRPEERKGIERGRNGRPSLFSDRWPKSLLWPSSFRVLSALEPLFSRLESCMIWRDDCSSKALLGLTWVSQATASRDQKTMCSIRGMLQTHSARS